MSLPCHAFPSFCFSSLEFSMVLRDASKAPWEAWCLLCEITEPCCACETECCDMDTSLATWDTHSLARGHHIFCFKAEIFRSLPSYVIMLTLLQLNSLIAYCYQCSLKKPFKIKYGIYILSMFPILTVNIKKIKSLLF